MSTDDRKLFLLITRLTYPAEGMTSELRLFFSRFLTFHFRDRISVSRISDMENRFSFEPLNKQSEIKEAASGLSIAELSWIIAALHLLKDEAIRKNERVFSGYLQDKIDDLLRIFSLSTEASVLEEQRKTITEEYKGFTSRSVIRIQTSILPLTIDYLLRWMVLLGSSWAGWEMETTSTITFSISIAILLGSFLITLQQRRKTKAILEKHGGSDKYQLLHHLTPGQYTWLAFYFASSVFVGFLSGTSALLVGVTYGIYYSGYFLFFRVGRFSDNDIVGQLDADKDKIDQLSPDENDEVIVSMETRLNASTGRLDAYVLESALFGALSFSGFLQIMAANLISMSDLGAFSSSLLDLCTAFIRMDSTGILASLTALQDKKSLFCMISVQSLACSMLFMAVIAARLRFSNIADRVRTAINMARAFNEKEERLLSETPDSQKNLRQIAITDRINTSLREADSVLKEVKPVMEYMEYFRNSGIATFLIILVTSSLFITSTMGLLLALLIPATYVYFNRSRLQETLNALLLDFRVRFNRNATLLMILALIPLTVAFALRIFTPIKEVQFLLATGYLLIGIYLCIWLLVASHLDEHFGEIEVHPSRLRRWNIVKNTLAVTLLIYMIGKTFKELQLDGANALLLISSNSIAILMYFAGYYLSKSKWLGILCGWMIATATVGVLFKNLNLNGANVMISVPLFTLSILLPVVIWKRKMVHQLLLRIIIIGLLISCYYAFGWLLIQ